MSKQPSTSAEIRQAFLDFFAARGHEVVASSSLVPGNDPTLLFTNAGMVQFKDVFLGMDKRPYVRAATSQKCMRISGKHNDLENVGPSRRHHTFFEMLGNFSFGDYFKREAIVYAYELLTQVYKLPPERLVFTVYQTDDEAYDIWTKVVGVDPRRVARMGPKTNFWQMAETGPCGPTSEIHWDNTPELGADGIIDALTREDDRFLELWNLVFMQFNRTAADPDHSGQFDQPLPAPGVDTGMGLERIVATVQQAASNYDTDLFQDIMDATQEILGHSDEFRQKNYVAYRVIADHSRAASFLIADGVTPGNSARSYIARMIIRRAWRFAYKMGVSKPFLADVADAVIEKMTAQYPELRKAREKVRREITQEEKDFIATLDRALGELDKLIGSHKAGEVLSGESAFFLYATHGLPMEITRDIVQERGLTIDEAGYRAALDKHSETSRAERRGFDDVTVFQAALEKLKSAGSLGPDGVEYDPYDLKRLSLPTEVLALFRDGQAVDSVDWDADEPEIAVVLASTGFYVESGGQMGDTGVITGPGWEFEVSEVRRPIGGLILHIGRMTDGGTLRVKDAAQAQVNHHRRWDIMRNHTATHLLHASLRSVLGEHVHQQGSLVAPELLRFDFSHDKAISDEEMARISEQVQQMILANAAVEIVYKPLDQARQEGAMALFSEKYGSIVRTVNIPSERNPRYSYELCGGTHVSQTGQIGSFVVTHEESSSKGVRRITALTGSGAQRWMQDRISVLGEASAALGVEPDQLAPRVQMLQEELKAARKQIAELEQQQAAGKVKELVGAAETQGGSRLVIAKVQASDDTLLGWMADRVREHLESGVVVLAAEINGGARLVAKVSPDLHGKGLKAGDLIRNIADLVGGKGGGRPDFATAGGSQPSGIDAALTKAGELARQALK